MRTLRTTLMIIFTLAFLLSSCAAPEPPKAKLETTTLKMGFGVDLPFAPHVIGIQKGWFKEAGFETIETPTFSGGAVAGEALAANQIQLWTPGNLPPINFMVNSKPIAIIGTDVVAYVESFVVRNDAKVEKPEDLYRIKIGLQAGSTASAIIANIAKKYNLDIKKMQIVNLGAPEQLAAITKNEIQAFLCWNPWPYQAMNTPGLSVTIMHDGRTSNFPWDKGTKSQMSFTRSLWVTSQQFIKENPNSAKAMTNVLLRAQKFVADPANKEEVLKIFSEYQKQTVDMNRALWDGYVFDTTFDDNYVRDMQAYTDFLFDTGAINKKVDPLTFTYTQFVKDFNTSLVKVEGKWKP